VAGSALPSLWAVAFMIGGRPAAVTINNRGNRAGMEPQRTVNSEILRLCPTRSGQGEEHDPKRTYQLGVFFTDKFWGKIG
jgi:hypothetical protein